LKSYDIVIVGGGIHGTGMAQAAAAAGHSVLLLEEQALASGSSSRSSKLIHGGLRYLETGQLRLVRESLHERTTLLRLAPELVRLRRFHVPIYRQTRRQPWQLRVGLSLYATLAGFRTGAGFGTLPRQRWHELEGLRTRDLKTVFWYQDGQTDDALLTAAVMRSAQSLGAELALPARFVGATATPDGVAVRYVDGATGAAGSAPGGVEREVQARVLVNAAGPWAAEVARQVRPSIAVPTLELVQGTHLLLDLPARDYCFYVESPRDGRAIFFMPRHGHTLVGTTEVRFRGDPRRVAPSPNEITYLRGVTQHYFGAAAAQHRVLEAFAGLRVLPAGTGHAFHRSRETLLLADDAQRPRVLSIYGGKLTTWRAVSDRALALIAAALPARQRRARTDELPLTPA
jgi:glycerol-3-phosphate dehydrogenase